MKKKIAIIGSTGSIGTTTLELIKKDKFNFKVELISTNTNTKKILAQSKKFKVKNVIIHNEEEFTRQRLLFKKNRINLFQNVNDFNKTYKKKFDYTMISIMGLAGLKPTLQIIKKTKNIAIANKESIICGWNLISNELKKNKTNFIPVDSEHFSIWSLLEGNKFRNKIDKVYITASGGPFYNLPLNKMRNATPKDAIKHPNWKMGKKISVDSATLMNKVFEVIEAKNIFDLKISDIEIFIHPQSYVHAMIKFINGITKILIHETSMKIPIFNSIYTNKKKIMCEDINLKKLNNSSFHKVNKKKFPSIKLLKLIPNKISLFETLLVSANDELVDLFLNNKIKFYQILNNLFKFIKNPKLQKYRKITPKNADQIEKLSQYVRLKIRSLSV